MAACISVRLMKQFWGNKGTFKYWHKSAKKLLSTSSCCSSALNTARGSALRLSGRNGNFYFVSYRCRSSTVSDPQSNDSHQNDDYHNIIKSTEIAKGEGEKYDFQAETRMLLDIVAKSLYSEKEIFIRELISNSNDALEHLRYLNLTNPDMTNFQRDLEIHIATDKLARTFAIQDTGVGMTKEELVSNLGTIARSGSKAFLKEVKEKNLSMTNIIGQFGVGFYSSFMVADKVEVFTCSKPGGECYKWVSDGSGSYEISIAEGVQPGTKIVLHLKGECLEFSDEDIIKGIIKKYSNFVGNPIYLNGKRINTIQALWLMDPKDVSNELHEEFYRFITGAYDRPRYWLHYQTDAPLNIRCLLYVPEGKPGLFEMGRESDIGVSLYCRKVLIKNRADNILPKWMRFIKGVVDSEDIPLNLSRELLQDSALIRRLRTVLTNRLLRFINDQARKDPDSYADFIKDYGIFLKEGIISSPEQIEKEEIAKLLRYESSNMPPGERVSLPEYCGRMREGQKDVFYLAAPSRHLAETSPYFEALKQKEVEVLFCYEQYDELVLLQLRQFDRKNITSVEKEMFRDKEDVKLESDIEGGLSKTDAQQLIDWLKKTLKHKVGHVKATHRLSSHPCAVTVEEMGAARHFVKTQFQSIPEEQRYKLLEPTLEINLSHPIMTKLSSLVSSNPKLAELVAEQVMDNAMVAAGLIDDPRSMISRMNELLTIALEKH